MVCARIPKIRALERVYRQKLYGVLDSRGVPVHAAHNGQPHSNDRARAANDARSSFIMLSLLFGIQIICSLRRSLLPQSWLLEKHAYNPH